MVPQEGFEPPTPSLRMIGLGRKHLECVRLQCSKHSVFADAASVPAPWIRNDATLARDCAAFESRTHAPVAPKDHSDRRHADAMQIISFCMASFLTRKLF